MCFQTKGYLWFSVYLLPRKDCLGPSLLFPLYDLVHEFRLPKVCYFPVRRSVLGSPYTSRGPYSFSQYGPTKVGKKHVQFFSLRYFWHFGHKEWWKSLKNCQVLFAYIIVGRGDPSTNYAYILRCFRVKQKTWKVAKVGNFGVVRTVLGYRMEKSRPRKRARLANAEDLYSGSFRSWRKNKLDISIHIVNQSILEPNSPF